MLSGSRRQERRCVLPAPLRPMQMVVILDIGGTQLNKGLIWKVKENTDLSIDQTNGQQIGYWADINGVFFVIYFA